MTGKARPSWLHDSDLEARFMDAWNQLGKVVVEVVVAKSQQTTTAKRIATGRDNPYGSKTLFLQAAARGDFATFPIGRAIGAMWDDVLHAMASRPYPGRRKRSSPQAPSDPGLTAPVDARARDLELLREHGVIPSPGRTRRPTATRRKVVAG